MYKRDDKALGRLGESLAANYLRRKGYRILGRNYRSKIGELDLIAAKDRTLVFVEVKTRTGTGGGQPYEAVDNRKQKKLLRLANGYLAYGGVKDLNEIFDDTRIDVISILMSKDGHIRSLEHIKDAFGNDCQD
jgi:putative endonuclease